MTNCSSTNIILDTNNYSDAVIKKNSQARRLQLVHSPDYLRWIQQEIVNINSECANLIQYQPPIVRTCPKRRTNKQVVNSKTAGKKEPIHTPTEQKGSNTHEEAASKSLTRNQKRQRCLNQD